MRQDRWGLAQVAGLGGALVGYLGLGVAIWNLTQQILPLVVYALLVITAMLATRIHTGQREIRQLEARCQKLTAHTQESAHLQSLTQGLSGFVSYLTEEPRADYVHHFTHVTEEYAIHGDDGTYNWTLRGHNATEHPSERLHVKFYGDRPTTAKALDITVVDMLRPEEDPKVELVKDMPLFKAIAIAFDPPLPPGGEFFLKVSCRWNDTFTREREHDYIIFTMGRVATQGVDRIVGRLICDLPISEFVMEEFSPSGLVRATIQPHQAESTFHRTILEWQGRDPRNIFLLKFRKEVPLGSAGRDA
ncbi:hypothetical protein [Nonomuraea sp. NPDC050540]|uniref:hypothetical protein n=1 Tax=Nonomuraea sp. NPDC050540 TaxID=3364367 RepID=UPI0037ABE171